MQSGTVIRTVQSHVSLPLGNQQGPNRSGTVKRVNILLLLSLDGHTGIPVSRG